MAEEDICVRRATCDDIPSILEFIKTYWNENHVFVKHPEFFRYMCMDGENVNFIIGIDDKKHILYGLEGFTLYNSSSNPDSSGMMWRCLPTNKVMLGIEIDRYMRTFLNQRLHFGVGSNPNTTVKIAKRYYKDVIGKLDHFYRLNDVVYKIAYIKNKTIIQQKNLTKKLSLVQSYKELSSILLEEQLKNYYPYKDLKYIWHRYFEHPIYQYDVWNIVDKNVQTHSILVTRKIWLNNSNVIKIIDFIGEEQDLSGLGNALDILMEQDNSEYVDIYSYGLSPEILTSAGLIHLQGNDENIIPNYFEPFEQKNVDIYFVASDIKKLHLYRGDADQDRPNIISNNS